MSDHKKIIIKGAKMHNLKNLSLEIPREKLVVLTGVSGSGKSSLAFDTIYAEGQRRYIESLSTYARQFLQMMDKPEVESIEGLSPAISIDQKSTTRNPRSTVGTVTEIYDYLRLLFAKVGTPHCIICGEKINRHSSTEIVDKIAKYPLDTKIMLLAPLVQNQKGEHLDILRKIQQEGFIRLRVDGEIRTINESIVLDPQINHSIEIVVDRLVIKDFSPIRTQLSNGNFLEEVNPDRTRLADSVELSLKHGNGIISVLNYDNGNEEKFSERYICPHHPEFTLSELSPSAFSFNSPQGACPHCHGLGAKMLVQTELVMPNPDLSIAEGAIHPWAGHTWHLSVMEQVAKKYNFSLDTPIKDLNSEQIQIIIQGTGEEIHETQFKTAKINGEFSSKYEGIIAYLERRLLETDSEHSRQQIERYMKKTICPVCEGNKLKKEILGVKIQDANIIDITKLSITNCQEWFQSIAKAFNASQQKIAKPVISEILNRLNFLEKVGLPYLSLDRSANTLSGGEAQRIRLATQIGSALIGVLYVLDEPSIGLHQRDNHRLIETMQNLKKLGNSVLVVEHDEDTIRAADHLIEIGPAAGEQGGQIISQGSLQTLIDNPNSLTGDYLSGRKKIPVPSYRRQGNGHFLEILGANENNLKNVDVKFPLGCLIGVSGVSGSGKSTLIKSILGNVLANELNRARREVGSHEELKGLENLDKLIHIDQSPIGRTPRSNPATYTNVFTAIRELFASQPVAKLRGYNSGRFSFNIKGGRCESCKGDGVKKIEMHFLSDIYIPCDVCHGKRYNQEALEIKWRGKSIADVLEMTVQEAYEFFSTIPHVKHQLEVMVEVGLGYIKLGQSATTLSGGEAQRVKLATELCRKATGQTMYILDEPTTGLHFHDIAHLLNILQQLVDKGNTVLLIEHNLDVLKTCDYLIDLGPEGGNQGG
ncbi:MAG TPA: excinuclease ABC subunit UvrA, partial [Candidatus Gracilibacteria bacterium]|nr:excinuclease ABC subunit UvrA [Candidatus Gracilibacteria bacterium]